MASNARVFTGSRALFVAAKTATPKSTATAATSTTAAATVTKKKSVVKKSTEKPVKIPKREKPVKPVDFQCWLSDVESQQDPMNKKVIICDHKLKTIFDGKDTVGFLEVAKLLAPHFVKTA